jgi:hypothetical protein
MNRQLASRSRLNGFSIQPDALAFLMVTTERRVLPTNLVQFDRLHSGMAFDGEQSIRSLNRPVLPRVAGENQPSMSLMDQPDKLQHLPPANLSRFVHHDDSAVRKFTLDEKIGDRRWRRKSSLLHLHDLLTLRRENDHAPARLPKLIHQFAQDKTFARARAAAKDRNAVCRTEQGFKCLALFVVELRIAGRGFDTSGRQSPTPSFAV